MREGWEITKLGAISEIFRGGSPRPIKSFITQEADGVNWIKIGDTEVGGKYIYSTEEKIRREGMRSSRYVEPGDFLLSNSMSFGRPYILKTDGCIHDGWLVIKKYDRALIQDFLYYLLLSPVVARQFEEGARGSTVRNLNTDIVSNVVVSYPVSHIEQQRIVDILDREFAKIDVLKANAEKSLQAAKDLFQATLKKELEPKEGWKTIRMGDYFRITSSKRVFQADWTDKGVPFYRAREIVKLAKYGSVDNDLFITPEMYDTYKAKYGVPKVGDVLITGVGTLGVCFLVENENPFYFKDGNVIWLQKEKEISSRYVIYCYQTNDVKEQVHSTQGAVVGTYTIEKANATTIPLPPTMEIQEEIVSRLDVLNDKCNTLQENYKKTLTLCDDLKQSLLRKAFNGEL